jgi:hypothetical protein
VKEVKEIPINSLNRLEHKEAEIEEHILHNQAPVMTTLPKSNDAIKTDVVRLHTVTRMDTIPESTMEEIRVEVVKEHREEDISHQPSTPFPKKRIQETEQDEETSSSKSTVMIAVGISVAAISVAAIFWLRRK